MSKSKLETLREAYGFGTVTDMLASATYDSVSPGICTNEDCDYTTDVEPDQTEGYCEVCGTQTVKSALILAGVI
jgi:hypothetical protein